MITTAADGEYWRLLIPGSHVLSVHAQGYSSKDSTVIVGNGEAAVQVNFMLSGANFELVNCWTMTALLIAAFIANLQLS